MLRPVASRRLSALTLAFTRPLSTMSVCFAPGSDTHALEPAVASLLPSAGGRWQLVAEGRALQRTFSFKTFAKTWAKIHSHHPEWSNVYNTTVVRWTTHNPRGLSDKDVRLAAICDSIATDFQEINANESAGGTANELLAKVVSDAGDCCTKK
ncbi:hypothetical protein CDD80_4038 [Ophiocordyceps camponoti-rufipedis]|uniref:4a-hydroxytetrahydrobiopterin dehydratase n=1 Tax=Ophiocordyceps camponoti-rufipedis TaxID=2004952 RepID=A0A2C5Y4U1_9HYPO|nr:hypothetical protein CDD80_4038 [Ophiocordyceps camponoti-rufipedis]